MKTFNYFFIAYSHMYGMNHGMHMGGCLDNIALDDAKEIAHSEAYDVVTGYGCIVSNIQEYISAQFDYDEIPEDPNEEYLEALEDAIEEECEYSIWEITPEGEEHWDEMDDDYESYEDFLKSGWIVPIHY